GFWLSLLRELAAVCVDVTEAVVRFVFDQDQLRRLNDLARLRLLMKLKEAHRQAIGIGIFFRFEVHPLLFEVCGPWRVRQTAGHVAAALKERRAWRSTRIEWKALGHRLDRNATSAAATFAAGSTWFSLSSLGLTSLSTFGALGTLGGLSTLLSCLASASSPGRSTIG